MKIPTKCSWPQCGVEIKKDGCVLIVDGNLTGLCMDHMGEIFAAIVSGGMKVMANV